MDYKERTDRLAERAVQQERQETSNPVADWLASGITIAYNIRFAQVAGNHSAGLLLAQFWFWSGSNNAKDRDGWFWMTQEEITEQTMLTRYETETARKRLRDLGIVIEEKRGVPMKIWFRIDKERFFELAQAILLHSDRNIR